MDDLSPDKLSLLERRILEDGKHDYHALHEVTAMVRNYFPNLPLQEAVEMAKQVIEKLLFLSYIELFEGQDTTEAVRIPDEQAAETLKEPRVNWSLPLPEEVRIISYATTPEGEKAYRVDQEQTWEQVKEFVANGELDSVSVSEGFKTVELSVFYWSAYRFGVRVKIRCRQCAYLQIKRSERDEDDTTLLEADVFTESPLLDALKKGELQMVVGLLASCQETPPVHLSIRGIVTVDVISCDLRFYV